MKKYVDIESEIFKDSLIKYSDIRDTLHSMIKDANEQRENQLIQRLKNCGFEFNNRIELESFLKTRCKITVLPNKLNQLFADNVLIAEWWDTVEITMEGNKATAIYGKHQ